MANGGDTRTSVSTRGYLKMVLREGKHKSEKCSLKIQHLYPFFSAMGVTIKCVQYRGKVRIIGAPFLRAIGIKRSFIRRIYWVISLSFKGVACPVLKI